MIDAPLYIAYQDQVTYPLTGTTVTFYFRISAINSFGESSFSTPVSVQLTPTIAQPVITLIQPTVCTYFSYFLSLVVY